MGRCSGLGRGSRDSPPERGHEGPPCLLLLDVLFYSHRAEGGHRVYSAVVMNVVQMI